MTELSSFAYDNSQQEKTCLSCLRAIRQAGRQMVHSVLTIGAELLVVKEELGHGRFMRWTTECLSFSQQTVNNYMTAARTIDKFPSAYEFPLETIYLMTHAVPVELQEEIIGQGPMDSDQAKEIIAFHKAEQWLEQTRSSLSFAQTDAEIGNVYHEAQQELENPKVRWAAVTLIQENKELFAALSGIEPQEILVDLGVTFDERYASQGIGFSSPILIENEGNCSLAIWAGGGVEDLIPFVIFPEQHDLKAEAYRRKAITILTEGMNARKLDDSLIK